MWNLSELITDKFHINLNYQFVEERLNLTAEERFELTCFVVLSLSIVGSIEERLVSVLNWDV